MTDVEIEQAILPLFDYFDANLPTLNTYLSDATKDRLQADPDAIDTLAIQLPQPADRLAEWTSTWQDVKAG